MDYRDLATSYPDWRLTGRPELAPGYLFGSQYPSLIIDLVGRELLPQCHEAIFGWLKQTASDARYGAPSSIREAHRNNFEQALDLLIHTLHLLQLNAGLPVFERGCSLSTSTETARCIIPTTRRATHSMMIVVERTLALFHNCACDASASREIESLAADVTEIFKGVRPSGSNMLGFIRAAYDFGIPVREMPGRIHLFGLGSRGRWLDSSFTDATPNLAARLARNKHEAASVLRMSGLPAPEHALARSPQEATALAQKIGYPVVIKPADLDGGVGVAAGLTSAEEVATAFTAARRKSRNILVEKHFEGRDYRLTVFQDQLIWAVERIPAGVMGDGLSSVQALIERENANPLRSARTTAPLQPLKADRPALELLRSQNLDMASIVPAGQFVRLCRAANIASGGTPVAVFERVHPDNVLLATRAARALKLDIAGIDLIISDIAISWRTSGAAICEVNGQPNLGQLTARHLYSPILANLIQGNGRIPVIVVITRDKNTSIPKVIADALDTRGMRTGYHNVIGVHLNGQTIASGERTPFDAGQILALESTTGAIVLTISDDSVLHTGLPCTRIDLLINMHDPADTGLDLVMDALLPACDGRVLHLGRQSGSRRPTDEYAMSFSQHPARLATAVAEAALEIDRLHRSGRSPHGMPTPPNPKTPDTGV